MDTDRDFDRLLAEGAAAPVEGWAFDWLAGRASEERPPWRYARLVAARMATAEAALDVDTGGGEMLAEVPHARVLRPGGTFLSQQVGPGTVRELSEAILGPLPEPVERRPDRAVSAARDAGLTVVDLREATLRTVFHDIAAVVWFLRKVVWTVPGFTVDRYRHELHALHRRIRGDGPFVAHARRFLVEAHRG